MFVNGLLLYPILAYAFFNRTIHCTAVNALAKLQTYRVETHFDTGSYFRSSDLDNGINEVWRQHISRQPYDPSARFQVLHERISGLIPTLLVYFEAIPPYRLMNSDAYAIIQQVLRQTPRRGPFLNRVHWTVMLDDHPGMPPIARGVAAGNPSVNVARAEYPPVRGVYHLLDLAEAFRAVSRLLLNPWEELKRVGQDWHTVVRVLPSLPMLGVRINYLQQPFGSNQYLLVRNLREALLLAAQFLEKQMDGGHQGRRRLSFRVMSCKREKMRGTRAR